MPFFTSVDCPLLKEPIQAHCAIPPKVLERLAALELRTLGDLLFHWPIRYENKTQIFPLADVYPGLVSQFQGQIERLDHPRTARQRLRFVFADDRAALPVVFYHVFPSMVARCVPGTWVRCFGEIREDNGGLFLAHPEIQFLSSNEAPVSEALTPVYPMTQGVSQQILKKLIQRAITLVGDWFRTTNDPIRQFPAIPSSIPGYNLGFVHALHYIHMPPPDTDVEAMMTRQHPAYQRLIFEELCAFHYILSAQRTNARTFPAKPLHVSPGAKKTLADHFGYVLTGAQQKAVEDILEDLTQPVPMNRLLQGDVGSGKTIVAAFAALAAVETGLQVALMAPTEVLAVQLHERFSHWFAAFGKTVVLLQGGMTAKRKTAVLAQLASGEAAVAIGTHALFQDGVDFADLGLVIIDEQHRFGVEQRLKLVQKSKDFLPHRLFMTATPIPRTLAMTYYGDMPCSVLNERPAHRKPIQTSLVPSERRADVIERLKSFCQTGQQVYWVCALIEESEHIRAQAAEQTFELLQKMAPECRFALLHGRQSSKQKISVLQDFKDRKFDVLVATSVVEVGVDVPNANLMVIENAERLGLSQCHQLRGRVGRGSEAAYCVLLYQHPCSDVAKQRLSVLKATEDGFKIAEEDLTLRGAGDILGVRQTGVCAFKVADLQRDYRLLPQCRDWLVGQPFGPVEAQSTWLAAWLETEGAYYHA